MSKAGFGVGFLDADWTGGQDYRSSNRSTFVLRAAKDEVDDDRVCRCSTVIHSTFPLSQAL